MGVRDQGAVTNNKMFLVGSVSLNRMENKISICVHKYISNRLQTLL